MWLEGLFACAIFLDQGLNLCPLCWQADSFFFFNWRIITLQYCDDFCHTSAQIRHRFTYVPSLVPPSHLSPHPTPLGFHGAQQIPTGDLFYVRKCICFGAVFSHHPTLPFPCSVQKSVLFVCISFCCSVNRVISTISLIPYICVIIWYLPFSFWFTSLCIIGFRFIHLIRADLNAFLSIAE